MPFCLFFSIDDLPCECLLVYLFLFHGRGTHSVFSSGNRSMKNMLRKFKYVCMDLRYNINRITFSLNINCHSSPKFILCQNYTFIFNSWITPGGYPGFRYDEV